MNLRLMVHSEQALPGYDSDYYLVIKVFLGY